MKILLIGETGQVGYELERSLQSAGKVIAVDRAQMDLTDLAKVRDVIRSVKPTLIVNPVAYTDVDRAESEPDRALLINGHAPAVMAEEAKKLGAAIIHYSTDYVFHGSKTTPYTEEDAACPINVYGRTKLAGELAIRHAGIPYQIPRTSWVCGMRGENFLTTVLRLAQARSELRIVSDQCGVPTWCRTIADTTAHIIAQSRTREYISESWKNLSGVYHLTAKGATTWYEFAQTILANSPHARTLVTQIATHEFPSPARRPKNSKLSSNLLISYLLSFAEMGRRLEVVLRVNLEKSKVK